MTTNDDEYWKKREAKATAELKDLNDRVAKGELIEKSEAERLLAVMDQWFVEFWHVMVSKFIELQPDAVEWERIVDDEWKKRRPELDRLLGPRVKLGLRFSKENIEHCLKEHLRRGGSGDDQN